MRFLFALAVLAAPLLADDLFETKVRPVLAAKCYPCHSAATGKPQGGLLLDSADGIQRGGNSGAIVQSGNPDGSLLIHALRYQDKDLRMPPGKALPAEVVAGFEDWIRAGAVLPKDEKPTASAVAKSRDFWSFQKPVAHPAPAVKQGGWVRNDVDRFILAKLEQKGLHPSAEAGRRTLIRRVSIDLTGLPATAEEADAFVTNPRPDAYERLVDRLLASPHYGERWGRYWLDVARYSDSRGAGDRLAFSYTYRDWVIRALNEDLPYDQFLTQQLAADRIPGNDPKNLAALGYISLGREFPKSFPETVDDRIDTVARGMLGLTVACARCHDHKYDPIPTKDYYSFYSIFSNIREPRELPLLSKANAAQTPLDEMYGKRLEHIRKIDHEYRVERSAVMNAFFRTQVAEYLMAVSDSAAMRNTQIEELVKDRQQNLHVLARWRNYLAASKESGEPVFREWHAAAVAERPALAKEYAERFRKYDGDAPRADAREEAYRLALRGADAPTNVPVSDFPLVYTEGDGNNTRGFAVRHDTMRALYAYAGGAPRAMSIEDVPNPSVAHVFVRGNANNPGVETPAHFLSALSDGEPKPFGNGSGRLELAQAITDKRNPVTARVMVNRVWMHHFGQGLVRTPSDFGTRGDPPTHPELLDTLAVQFMEQGWSLKGLHRKILLSAAYRQSSMDNAEARKVDPENLLLWRMNRQRLDIESLRDSMLQAAGQLDPAIGGVPFSLTASPVVPRRTTYGFIERGHLAGMLSAFDFAVPDQHVAIRSVTTVPQQALFLINSSFIAEEAAHLTLRPDLAAVDGAARIRKLYRVVLGREASPDEVALGLKFVVRGDGPSGGPGEEGSGGAAPSPTSATWQYGMGDGPNFQRFRYFSGDTWQGASMLPDASMGKARITAGGGEAGDTVQQAPVRRWISPVSGKISIEGTLKHNQSAVPTGDGVHGRIMSSRQGELAAWVVNGSSAETKMSGITVERGETLDFIVDGRADTENDTFQWAPVIKTKEAEWNAAKDFHGPEPRPLTVWERYARVLLETNEFAFVE
ncbi:MAG: PSD1 and planctomycete cytochrome C domain-containing protein [Acidobacteriota bacterium]|nr:PSD1 and planctomycete cytochrome C domain-containing protein [Acidobacteriota bacterium]